MTYVQSQIKYNELMENSAGVPSCTHRYLFKLTDVKALITGPGSLFPKIMLDNCNAHAFLEYRIGDITSISGVPLSTRRLQHLLDSC